MFAPIRSALARPQQPAAWDHRRRLLLTRRGPQRRGLGLLDCKIKIGKFDQPGRVGIEGAIDLCLRFGVAFRSRQVNFAILILRAKSSFVFNSSRFA